MQHKIKVKASNKTKKQTKARTRSRSRSKERKEAKTKKAKQDLNEIAEETENSEEDSFKYRKFAKLNAAAIDELLKIPGLKVTSRLRDDEGTTCIQMEATNIDSLRTATQVIDIDPLVLISPNIMLNPSLRQHQFNVHQFYSGQTSDFLKVNPAIDIPVVFPPGNPNLLSITFKSALAASLYEIQRFQGNFNPVEFNNMPHGTELGDMLVIFGGSRILLQIGPVKYYK